LSRRRAIYAAPQAKLALQRLACAGVAGATATARAAAEARPAEQQVMASAEAIAACESGGNPTAIGGGGLYRGKYQFSYETWHSGGGSGDPAVAPEAEQDRRAALLLARDGAGHWPVCGG
jgi:hypothetical protein